MLQVGAALVLLPHPPWIGAALGGALTALLGAPAYLAAASVGMAAAALLVRWSSVWWTVEIPTPDRGPVPAGAVPAGR